jgi:hypothetical protein
MENRKEVSSICQLGRLEEANILWAQGQHEMAISPGKIYYAILWQWR